jgi:beta-glucanase (GH16 family)
MNYIFLLLFLSAYNSIKSDVPAGYNLVWSDEFEGSSLDTTKWVFNIGAEPNWGNNELQYYTNRQENIYLADGILHIRARHESFEGSKYTSARITTRKKFDFKYGFIEARIALPRGMGIWPAFWMLAANDKADEIDIIEAVNTENIVYSTCHWYPNGEYTHESGATRTFDITQFHTYTVLWNENVLQFAVDGNEHFTLNIKDSARQTNSFHGNFYFLLNVAVGGNWPGFDIDDNQFPTEMQVDYIRVYKN